MMTKDCAQPFAVSGPSDETWFINVTSTVLSKTEFPLTSTSMEFDVFLVNSVRFRNFCVDTEIGPLAIKL